MSKEIKIDLLVFSLIFLLMFILVFLAVANSEGSDLKSFAKFLNEKLSFLLFPIWLNKYLNFESNILNFLVLVLIPSFFWFICYKGFQYFWKYLDRI